MRGIDGKMERTVRQPNSVNRVNPTPTNRPPRKLGRFRIGNGPNDWSDDPRYIVDLVKCVVRVSAETMKIVPAFNESK